MLRGCVWEWVCAHPGTDEGGTWEETNPLVPGGDRRLQNVPAAPASVPRGVEARCELGC